jgi:hypothetical protein
MALAGGLSDPCPAHGLSSIGSRGDRTHGLPGASCTSTARAGSHLALISWRRSTAGLAGRAVPRGRDHRGGTRRPHALRESPTADAMLGAHPRGIGQRCAPPPGCPHHHWSYACPSRMGRRGLGRSLAGQRQSALATQGGAAPNTDPRPQVEGASAPLSTLPTPAGPRDTCQPRRRRHRPGTRGLSVGHGQTRTRNPVSSIDRWLLEPPRSRCAMSIGGDAAPVWCHPRRREAAARNPRASSEAGTRRTPVRWYPTHG